MFSGGIEKDQWLGMGQFQRDNAENLKFLKTAFYINLKILLVINSYNSCK